MYKGLTHARVKECFDYSPEDGILRWKINCGKGIAGQPVGCVQANGSLRAGIDGYQYRLHRIIWFWMTGKWPKEVIDHKDRDKTNNKWNNLREATQSQNSLNKISTTNTTGHKGVRWRKDRNCYYACIEINGKCHWVGSFKTKQEAIIAYRSAIPSLCGEFTRFDEYA